MHWIDLPDSNNEPAKADDDALRAVIARLARPHRSGGRVVERAAVVAEGARAEALLAWIVSHAGEPEAAPPAKAGPGLHGDRGQSADTARPRRYVLPRGVLP